MKNVELRLSELKHLTPEHRRARVSQLSQATQKPVNGEVNDLDREIAGYEARFGMSSDAMRSQLAEGELEETEEVCRWLMRLTLRERLVELRSRAR